MNGLIEGCQINFQLNKGVGNVPTNAVTNQPGEAQRKQNKTPLFEV